jgi:putative hemolysin
MGATTTARKWLSGLSQLKESKSNRSIFEKIRAFKPHIQLQHETEDFIVRTADNGADLLKVLQLRHDIFIKEWLDEENQNGIDVDEYDFLADHLMIIEKASGEVIGNYRLLCSKFTDRFYSQSEFIMNDFVMWPWTKLEMGRACIHADFRDGNTIDLLWKGLSRYIHKSGTKYLFGCTSITPCDPDHIGQIYRSLIHAENWRDEFRIRPNLKYELKDFDIEKPYPLMSPKEFRSVIPPLLRSYMHAGAKVYGLPAHDKAFDCIDMFTIMDMAHLNKKFKARYFDVLENEPKSH